VRLWLTIWRLMRQPLRYSPEMVVPGQWTEADARAWAGFLRTDSGRKLDVLMVHHVLDQTQEAVTKRGDAYEVGTANGVRQTWVQLKTLSANGAAPEDGSNQ
jgi:hypothetical protein